MKLFRYSIYDHQTDTRISINPEYLKQLIALYVQEHMLGEQE
jgi:hypothetical protein